MDMNKTTEHETQSVLNDTLSNEFMDAIIENSFDGIYITDGKGNTIKVNRSYLIISGLKKDDVMGYNMKELVRNGTISASGSLMAIAQRRPVTIQQEFRTGKRALVTSNPIFDHKNKIALVVTNVRDITELYHLKQKVSRSKQTQEKLQQELHHVKRSLENKETLVAQDPQTIKLLMMLDKVAPMDTTVILFGETGVGKEVFAKYIFEHSSRSKNPFIKINCGAIPPALFESELFGYEKGAFTGANKEGKMGMLELADTGTVFLDEVGELPLDMQVKILRVLQEQEFERIGGRKPIKVDIRVISATNRNLEEMVEQKTFRQDLYYRLMIFPINIPPLRERKGDIIPLSNLFLEIFNKKYKLKKFFSLLSTEMLLDYHWSGNIRELRNIVERSVIISNEDEITPESLPLYPVAERPRVPGYRLPVKNLKAAIEELEIDYVNKAYETYGNVRDAAASLGIAPSTFVRKRQKFNITIE